MEVRKYWALLRRRFWIILLSAVLAGVIAFTVNSNRVKLYRSTADFLIDVAAGSGSQREYAGQLIAKGLVQDYLQIIPTSPIANEVIERLSEDYPEMADWSARRLLGMINLSSPFETQLISISVVDNNRQRAADIANMIGVVFGEVNAERSKSRFSVPIEKLDDQLSGLDGRIGEIEIAISQFGEADTAAEEAELSRLQRSLNELQTNYNTAFQTRLDLDIEQARSLNNFIGTEPAIASFIPISPRTNSNTVMAVAVVAFVALGIVLLVDYLDDTVKSPNEVFDHTGLSSLATISYIEGVNPPDRLIAHKAPRDPVSEAYRMLRTNLSFASISSEMNCVLVTSSSPGEGKSTTSANVATVLAQTGRRVILVDADLRRPSQHKIFELSTNLGLTTALLDTTMPITHHLQQTKVPGLRLMASGPVPPNPAELLNSARMQEVLQGLLEDADFVLVDTPPVLTVADAAILAPNVNGCVLVAEVGKTQMEMLEQANARMRNAGANMFGIVMNRYNARSAGYYYYDANNKYYTQDYKAEPATAAGGPRRVLVTLFGFGD
ncbi:MAG: polysaccharide biosynthesis tyrosine autokinase [Candidatus Promineifilaceae bacterium]